ncbi:MAG TPA: hypothetical protein VNZ63_08575 [Verrucomicrobiae bacterium]|nr:hypothetical protein [Verrucomicrobiae bacterium]
MANTKILGIEGLSPDQLRFELQRGGRFVVFQYCVSVLILSFKRSSPIYFVRSGENPAGKGIRYTLLTAVAGWWGIPWGPIFSVQTIYRNLSGGKDVTNEVTAALASPTAPVAPRPADLSKVPAAR